MKSVRMTDRWLQSVRQIDGRIEFSDALTPGLRLRVSRRSKKWSLLTRKFGKQIRLPIGEYPEVGLLEARRVATELLSANKTSDLVSAIEQITSKSTPLMAQVCQDYADKLKSVGKPSYKEYERALIKSPLGICAFMYRKLGRDAEVGEVKTKHVADWLRETHERSPSQAQHCRAYLHAVFEWAIKARYDYTTIGGAKNYGIVINPVTATPNFKKSNARSRVLTLDELSEFWRQLPEIASPETTLGLRMVVAMGGLRISEILHSQKNWYSEGWLTLPETKNGREHAVPLTETAKKLFNQAVKRSPSESRFLYSHKTDTKQPILITSVGRASRRMIDQYHMKPFQLRDIRRTMKTHLLDRGYVEEREIDIWHNHGQKSDIARKHYTWAEYRELKKCVAASIDRFLIDTHIAT